MNREFSAVSTPALVSEITTLAGHLNAGNARFLALVAELDRRRGWAEAGVKSMAHWLNWKCGIDLGEIGRGQLLIELDATDAHANQTSVGEQLASASSESWRETGSPSRSTSRVG